MKEEYFFEKKTLSSFSKASLTKIGGQKICRWQPAVLLLPPINNIGIKQEL